MLTRIALFFLTLFLGIQAVALANYLTANFSLPADTDVAVETLTRDPTLAGLPKGVRISYNGMFPRTKDAPPTLRFLIYNGSGRELFCLGYGGSCASPKILVRGLDAGSWECMNGSSHYKIKPGETAELKVYASDFNLLPDKTEEVVIGYDFGNLDRQSDKYYAEPIVLPAEFRKALRKYLKEISEY